MNKTKRIIIVSTVLAIGCFSFAFYLSKYHKVPFAEVSFTTNGCFHHTAFKFTLRKEGDATIARLDSGNTRIKERFISKHQLNKFYLFVNEVPKTREGFCTSVDQYVIRLQGEIVRKDSESCYSFSFRKLMENYFEYYL